MQDQRIGDHSRPVAIWIMVGVGMLLIQVVLGGITRLTGSGLSITEWNVVTGALPPLNEQQWLIEFEKYRQTPQYQLLNTHFSLADFKFIFFWEWFHRLWARLIAVAFLIPFVIFLIQRRIKRHMVQPLVLLFLFGALQGAIGWIMVMSGLTGDAIYVKPTRLALHFIFALGLIAYAFWVALKWLAPSEGAYNPPLRKLTVTIIVILFVQLVFGALMAGHKAAMVAPTWPTINGSMVPSGMIHENPVLINLIENKITVHFVHRTIAYLLLLFIGIWTIRAYRSKTSSRKFDQLKWTPATMVGLQALLGILALFSSSAIIPNHWGTFEWLALFHQIVGMLLLISMVTMLFFLTPKQRRQHL